MVATSRHHCRLIGSGTARGEVGGFRGACTVDLPQSTPTKRAADLGGCIGDDEIQVIDDIRVTTAARTALDIASRQPTDRAVPAIDSLARATRLQAADVELLVDRYRGRNGIRRARATLDLVDAGAESPRETWLRLLIVRSGLPRPRTQIPVLDEYRQLVARVDMGWEDWKIAVEYDGEHHWTDRRQMTRDIRRTEQLGDLGWIVIRVTADDTPATILHRIGTAIARRSSVSAATRARAQLG